MMKWIDRGWMAGAVMGVVMGLGGVAWADGITREQGDEILKELREIRRILEPFRGLEAAEPPQASAKPPSTHVRIGMGTHPAMGAEDAPVVLVEFTDYQCPFCRRHFSDTYPELKRNYIDTGKIRYVVRDLPLSFHRWAEPAAVAARCAQAQDAYWPMHDQLFANAKELSEERFTALAQGMSLDMAAFGRCLADDTVLARVREDGVAARAIGLTGTPSFVLGRITDGGDVEGEKIIGAQPYRMFSQRIDALLAEE